MKKIFIYLLVALFLFSVVLAAPPGQAKKQPTTSGSTATSQPQVIIIQNQTAAPQEGVNWEFVGALMAILAGVAAVIGWLFSRRASGATATYLREIDRSFNQYKNNASKCESELYSLKHKIEKDFAQGKIKDSGFSILDGRLDKYLSEVRKDVISSEFKLSSSNKKELNEMLDDGIISEEEYEKFSKMKLEGLSSKDKEKLNSLMKKWKAKKK